MNSPQLDNISLDDLHRNGVCDLVIFCWIYLSFLDDLHLPGRKVLLTARWIYLSFLDDLHPVVDIYSP